MRSELDDRECHAAGASPKVEVRSDAPNNAQRDILAVLHQPRPLYRGLWADQLFDGQELPVGGSIFDDKLTTKLELDFASFIEATKSFTREKLEQEFKATKAALEDWLNRVGASVDSYAFFAATRVMLKVQEVLAYDRAQPDKKAARGAVYRETPTPKLSTLKGKAMCAEYAAMGQYLLQKVGMSSSYVTGVSVVNPDSDDLENHSFLVIAAGGEDLIFDIARPITEQNLPRLLRPVVPFTYDVIKDKRNMVIKAEDILRPGHEIYFGVGNPMDQDEPNVVASGAHSN